MLNFTFHALWRMALRGLSKADIDYVLANGKCHFTAGANFYYLGKRQIPYRDSQCNQISRLEGTVVLLSKDDSTVITVYRNKKSFVPIRSKAKYIRAYE
ncbi:DUF4258 domain-containing protein [Bellilinea sp.]